jgi:hypothetical protein
MREPTLASFAYISSLVKNSPLILTVASAIQIASPSDAASSRYKAAGSHSNAIKASFGFSPVPRMKRRPEVNFLLSSRR